MAIDRAEETVTSQTKKSRIPTFASIEEEAEFWDTHDTTEFQDEFEEVVELDIRSLVSRDRIMLRLDEQEMDALWARAREAGTGPGALAYAWIVERLGQSRQR